MEIYPDSSENKIKCERRFNDFYLLYQRLQRIFPFIIIPKLEKDYKAKLKTNDEKFFIKRINQLKQFLKYINNHDDLRHTKEFIKFIQDPNFDCNFFNEEVSFCNFNDFHESNKNHKSFKDTIAEFFLKNPFSYNDQTENNFNDCERDFLRKLESYKEFLSKFQEFEKKIVIYFFFYLKRYITINFLFFLN